MEQTKDIRNLFKVIFPPKLQILSKDLRKRLRQKYYIIETVDETSGFALIHYHNGIYHLDYLGVNPTIQGKGIGTKLLTTVIKKYKKISLECEKNLVPYYSKFGFIDSKLEYSWHHQKMHLMVRQMTTSEIMEQLKYLQQVLILWYCFLITVIKAVRHQPEQIVVYLWFDKHRFWT